MGWYGFGAAALAAGYALWFGTGLGGVWTGVSPWMALVCGGVGGLGYVCLRAPMAKQVPGQAVAPESGKVRTGTAAARPPEPEPEPDAESADRGLQAIVDHVHLVLMHTDASGYVLFLSRAWENIVGRPVAEALGRSAWAFLHPDDTSRAQAAWQRLLRGETEQLAQEWRLIDATGKAVWVSIRARGLNERGGMCGAAATMEEIGRRQQLDERLQATRGYVNALLANVPGLVYRSRNDRTYTMEFISDGCLELTGYEPYELIENRRLAYGDLVHPEDREFLWTHIQAHLARQAVYQVAYRITDAAGRLRWVWEQGRGVFASQGELLAIEGFITDMSERRGAEEQAKRRLWFEARTGLTSRPIFDSLLAWSQQHAQVGGSPCALLVIELPGMQARIEQQGKEWGERALTVLARRLGPALGPGAQTTYLGQHQFAALVHDLRAQGLERAASEARALIPAASRLAQSLAERLASPLPGDTAPGPGAAIGIAFTQARYAGAEALLQAARQTARQAAALGAGHCEFADE